MSGNFGRYEILEEIGQGGFAIVSRALDTQLDRLVALKVLRPILLQDTAWVKRFHREAKTVARLDHPRIVTIHDVSDLKEQLFIVMRLVDGPSLEEVITTQGRIPWPEAVEIITAVAEGLDYAHAQGILHRDLKPANILMDPERGPLLSDFGLAKLVGESSMSMSASGSVVGTPHYIAPELWEGQRATRQSDIYALGCILCEMLTGEKVFKGDTPPAVMMAHFKPPALPQTWSEGVPPDVATVLRTALASRPAERYATVDDMSRALLALSDIAPEPGRADVIGLAQQDTTSDAQSVEIAGLESLDALLTGGDIEDAELTPAQQPHPTETLSQQVTTPSQQVPKRKISLASLNFQKLEDTIADLPPKWHSFLKNLSMAVIIVFMLAIANLFTSSYPWFIWIALAAGVLLAIRFVNLLFEDRNQPILSPSPVVQPGTPPPSDPVSTVTPTSSQQTPVSPPTSKVQATTSSVNVVSTTTHLPDQKITASPSDGQPAVSPQSISRSPAARTPSQIHARERRKRSGCMWISIALGGIFLVLIVGVGGFCSVVGSLLDSAIPVVEVGSTLTENINVAVPDTSNTPNLSLKILGGEFSLVPGAEKGLVEGTATYNVPQLKPTITTNGNNIRIHPEEDIGLGALTTEGLKNIWDLRLASVPMELIIDTGGTDAEIELGSLSLADLAITHGGGNFQLSFSESNQIEMKTLEFKGGASSATLAGLANARTEEISFEAGAGDFTLDFSGELQNDVDVTIQGGLGAVTIIVPKNTAAQISVNNTLSDVEMTGAWEKSGDNEYIMPGEGHKIAIKAEIGFGALKLRTMEN